MLRMLKYSLWTIVFLFLCFVLSIPLSMYGNYLILKATAETVIEKELGAKISRLKEFDISDIGIDPSAHWWFEITPPLDQNMLDKLQDKFSRSENNLRSNGDFKYDTNGFQYYASSGLDLGSGTVCDGLEISSCFVSILAKKGDKNVFIFVSAR